MSSYNDFVDQMLREALNKKNKKEEPKEDLSSMEKVMFNIIDAARMVGEMIVATQKDVVKDFFKESLRDENMNVLSDEEASEIADEAIDLLNDMIIHGYRKVKEEYGETDARTEIGRLTDVMMSIESIDEDMIKDVLKNDTFPKEDFLKALITTYLVFTHMVMDITGYSNEELLSKIRSMYKEENNE